eukprot:gnl/Dysnectes_brevis/6154_a9315_475.p1 GENE.gnl/Dysnectes_brevis/6154_a9315_475~~gnl/Dysnectes_brevis/6154_a9315_475.p1  ORF type:complete len:881 (+),score=115.04 gnl/Dysnectes_brevis/6154_a9315_475:127-2769(+)
MDVPHHHLPPHQKIAFWLHSPSKSQFSHTVPIFRESFNSHNWFIESQQSGGIVVFALKHNAMIDMSGISHKQLQRLRNSIEVFSSDGTHLKSIILDEESPLVGLGVFTDGHIFTVTANGNVTIFTSTGLAVYQQLLFAEGTVLGMAVDHDSFVIIATDHRLFYAANFNTSPSNRDNPATLRLREVSDPRIPDAENCHVAMQCPDKHPDGSISAILAPPNGREIAIVTLEARRVSDIETIVTPAGLCKIKIDPRGQFLLAHCRDPSHPGEAGASSLRVWDISGHEAKARWRGDDLTIDPFSDLVGFCAGLPCICVGGSSVRLDILFPRGKSKATFSLPAMPIILVSEVDGAAIVLPPPSAARILALRVSAATRRVFDLGSTCSSACLYLANEQYQKGNPQADQLLRSVSNLAEAAAVLMEAAAAECDPSWQRSILRAAGFGKLFADSGDQSALGSQYRQIAELIRLTNGLALLPVGMLMTVPQLRTLGYQALVARLCNRGLHGHAVGICKLASLELGSVARDWAQAVMANPDNRTIPDAQMFDSLVQRLEDVFSDPAFENSGHPLSWRQIARMALVANRPRLASLLIDREPRVEDQVRVFIEMGSYDEAVSRALEAGDSELVLHAIRCSPEPYRALTSPAARALFIDRCLLEARVLVQLPSVARIRPAPLDAVRELAERQSNGQLHANVHFHQAHFAQSPTDVRESLERAVDACPEDSFLRARLEGSLSLIDVQFEVGRDASRTIVGFTGSGSVAALPKKQALAFGKKAGLHPLAISKGLSECLARAGEWQELVSQAKKYARKGDPWLFFEAGRTHGCPTSELHSIIKLMDRRDAVRAAVELDDESLIRRVGADLSVEDYHVLNVAPIFVHHFRSSSGMSN